MWFPEWIYTIDILFAVFVVIFIVRGTRHGLSGELAHVVTLTALLAGFFFFYPQLLQWTADYWPSLSSTAVKIIVPAVLLLSAGLLFLVVRALFKQMLKSKLGETADKIAGGMAGAVRGVVLGSAVVAGLSLISDDALYRALSEKSTIGRWVCNTLTPWAEPRVKELPAVKEFEKSGKAKMRDMDLDRLDITE